MIRKSKKSFTIKVFLLLLLLISAYGTTAKEIVVSSPDGKAVIKLDYTSSLMLSVDYNKQQIMAPSLVSMNISEYPEAFSNPVRGKVITRKINTWIVPPVAEKRSRIKDEYNETEIWFKGNYGIKLRAYNDGVAWRLITRFHDSITINNETVNLNMAAADSVYYGDEDNFVSHSERFYTCRMAGSIKSNQMGILPAVFRKVNGTIAAFTESDLLDYPGLYLLGSDKGDGSFSGTFPKVVDQMKPKTDRDYGIVSRKEYIARTNGTREFPWRGFGLAENEARLLENDIAYRLGSPCRLAETSWIKPGKVAWDWWNDWNISGVPFKSGINTDTYKYYIDFASANKLEYVVFDEGWSKPEDLEKINPDMDMDALFAYAKQKNIGMTQNVLKRVYDEHSTDLKSLNAPELKLAEDGKVPRFTIAQIHEMYTNATKTDTTHEKDLNPDEERFISDHARKQLGTDLVYAIRFPIEAAKFYHKLDKDDGTVLWGDLIFRGTELATVPLRENNYENMIEQMKNAGLDIDHEGFKYYLQAFKYGLPIHGGCGFGIDRLTQRVIGLANVKEATLFPRDINRLTP